MRKPRINDSYLDVLALTLVQICCGQKRLMSSVHVSAIGKSLGLSRRRIVFLQTCFNDHADRLLLAEIIKSRPGVARVNANDNDPREHYIDLPRLD